MYEITEPDTSTTSWNARNADRIYVSAASADRIYVSITAGAHALSLALYGDTADRVDAGLGEALTAQETAVAATVRDVRAALDRIAAWAPNTARRVQVALAGGVPQRAVVAQGVLTALVLPADLEPARAAVLTALDVVAEHVPAVTA